MTTHPDMALEAATKEQTAKIVCEDYGGLRPDPLKYSAETLIGRQTPCGNSGGLRPDPPPFWFDDRLTLAEDARSIVPLFDTRIGCRPVRSHSRLVAGKIGN